MFGALRQLWTPKPPEAVNATYIALVAAARNPFFYTTLKVPDTLDGRFEMIVLHLFMLEYRLIEGASPLRFADLSASRLGVAYAPNTATTETLPPRTPNSPPENLSFAQFLSEAFFADMDSNIRELGVADTGVSKRIKKMGKAYHGCLQAYASAMGDRTTLCAALARNVYGTVAEGDVDALHQLAGYVELCVSALAATDVATILAGKYAWPDAGTNA